MQLIDDSAYVMNGNASGEFARIFRGHAAGYGLTVVGETVNGKAEAQCKLVYEPYPPYEDHLGGVSSIGIAPLREDNTCVFGALDIDDYEHDLMDIVRAIYEYNLPLIPCWSKSKKLHVYMFCSAGMPAADMIKMLETYRDMFGCGARTEIFPKQARLTSNTKFPSWINLPYFDACNEDNHRKMVNADGTLAGITEFVARVGIVSSYSYRRHMDVLEGLWFHEAPPCVQVGIVLHDVPKGYRNNWMFNVGVFARLVDNDGDYAETLREVNSALHYPINELELENTVIKGLEKNTYFYLCNNMFHCNSVLCRKRQFGVACKESTGLSYGEMRQIMTHPPSYEWDVNGITMPFENEQEIMGQTKFRALCMRHLHVMPRRIKDENWSAIITRAMENIVVVQPEYSGEAGYYDEGVLFESILHSFIQNSVNTENMHDVIRGSVVRPGDGYVYFSPAWFVAYFYDRKVLRLAVYEIYKHLAVCGCTYVDKEIMRIATPASDGVHTREEVARNRAEQEDRYV